MNHWTLRVMLVSFLSSGLAVGCAETSNEFDVGDDDATSATSDELKESREPKIEVRIAGTKIGETVCASRSLSIAPNLQSESLFKNSVEVFVEDLDTGWKKVVRTYDMPKAGIIRDLNKVENEVNLEAALGDLTKFEGHRLSAYAIQTRSTGKVVGRSDKTYFRIAAPKIDLATAQRSSGCVSPDPKFTDYTCVFLTFQVAAPYSKGSYACDEVMVHGVAPNRLGSFGGFDQLLTSGSLRSAYVIMADAPKSVTLVSRRDLSKAVSNSVEVR